MYKITNEEKVLQYKKEIEEVFSVENSINFLDAYEQFKLNNDESSIRAYDNLTLGRFHKTYWVKFEVDEPNLLNGFLMKWVVMGKSIAGVKGSVLDFGGVVDKQELKNKLLKFINEEL